MECLGKYLDFSHQHENQRLMVTVLEKPQNILSLSRGSSDFSDSKRLKVYK